jgi:threonine dehydrogenase-like Zn-dependent dehydrogenase
MQVMHGVGRRLHDDCKRRWGTMRAMVYHGPGEKSWDDVPDPKIQDDTDAIVSMLPRSAGPICTSSRETYPR